MKKNIDVVCRQNKLVSIIVPIFNRSHYLEQLINTVVSQTYGNWELLVVDDASTDTTKSDLLKLSETESRLIVLDNKYSKGPSGARNTGLDFARGEYIAYLDSDDEWINEHLTTAVYYLEKYQCIDVLSANPLRKNRSTGEVFKYDEIQLSDVDYKKYEECYIFDAKQVFNLQLFKRAITTQAIVGRSKLLKEVRWNESLNAAEDNMHNLCLSYKADGVGHLQQYHVIYWAHDDNITNCSGGHSPERMEKVEKSFVRFWEAVLTDFQLNKTQKEFVLENLKNSLAWGVAYNSLLPQRKYTEAKKILRRALSITPFDQSILKTYFIVCCRSWVYSLVKRFRNGVGDE